MVKKNKVLKKLKPTFELAGASLASSILGGTLQSKLPASIKNPLTETGRVTGTFVAPVATLGAMDVVTSQLKLVKLKKKK